MSPRAETVLLFAGQGAYTPGLLAGRADEGVREVLRVVDGVAAEFGRGPTVSALLLEAGGPSAAELAQRDPFALQLAIFAIGVIGHRLAEAQRSGASGASGASWIFAGHSMGEIAALTAAGAFELADGARLVCHRSEALAAACPRRGGMLSVQLSAARAAHLVALVDEPAAAVAVRNAPGLTVLAGPEEALESFVRIADAMGVRSSRLPAPYPFHSPMLALAAERFAAAIGGAGLRQRPLRARVYSPVAQGFVSDAMDLEALLVRQLTAQVDFLGALRALHEAGAQQFVEGIASGLATLVKRSVPGALMSAAGGGGGEAAMEREPEWAEKAPSAAAAGRTTEEPALAAATTTIVMAAAATATTATAAAALPAQLPLERVLGELRDLYAATLGYPPEAITAEADLEADLGIDSLKRAEMLAKVSVHFQLGDLDDGRFASHQTLAELASLVLDATEA